MMRRHLKDPDFCDHDDVIGDECQDCGVTVDVEDDEERGINDDTKGGTKR